MKSLLIAFAAVLGRNCARAVDVVGVKFDDLASVSGSKLTAHCAGLRQKAFPKVCAMALDLPEKQTLLGQPG